MQNKRTYIDDVRTIFWYRFVSKTIKKDTRFKFERLIEPSSFSINPEGGTRYSNRCNGYRDGKHTPCPEYTKKVEITVAPGSSRILNMPLWDSFKLDFHKLMKSSIVQRLPEIVQTKIFGAKLKENNDQLPKYNSRIGKRLVRLGSFDSLCALMLFWRIDKEDENHPNREAISINIYHLLLILSNELKVYDMSELIFHLFKTNVFDQATWNGKKFNLDYQKFEENEEILNYYWDNHWSMIRPKLKRNTQLAEILQQPSKIFFLNAILNDIFKLDEQALPPQKNIWLINFYETLKSNWARNILFNNSQEKLIEKIYNSINEDNRFNKTDANLLLLRAQIESKQRII